MKTKQKINKKMLIGELMMNYPKAAEILVRKYGLHCVGCGMAMMETIEQGAMAHGMSDEQIDKMLKELEGLENKADNR